jgi:hypothetical protein
VRRLNQGLAPADKLREVPREPPRADADRRIPRIVLGARRGGWKNKNSSADAIRGGASAEGFRAGRERARGVRREPVDVRCGFVRGDGCAPAPAPAPAPGARRGGGGGDGAIRRRDKGRRGRQRFRDFAVGGGESAQRAHRRHARVGIAERGTRAVRRVVVSGRHGGFARTRVERAKQAAEERGAFDVGHLRLGARRRERRRGPRELRRQTARARQDETPRATAFFAHFTFGSLLVQERLHDSEHARLGCDVGSGRVVLGGHRDGG